MVKTGLGLMAFSFLTAVGSAEEGRLEELERANDQLKENVRRLEEMGKQQQDFKDRQKRDSAVDQRIKLLQQYRKEGKSKDAERLWQESLKEFPDSVRIKADYVDYLIRENRLADAEKNCSAFMREFPEEQIFVIYKNAIVELKTAKTPEETKKIKDQMKIKVLDHHFEKLKAVSDSLEKLKK